MNPKKTMYDWVQSEEYDKYERYGSCYKRFYIQRIYGTDYATLVTVDEFQTEMEAVAYRDHYAENDGTARYYVSTRPCKSWRKKMNNT